ncbi:MAG: DMT family transporter [Treponema sp.]|nr:DMT family transporter [Treponema sp.]
MFAFCTILAGILWGLISIFLRSLTAAGFSSLQILFLRGAVSALFVAIIILFRNPKLFKIQLKDLWMFIGTGVVSLTFFSLCYFKTILETGTSIAVILLYTSPIFILVFSRFLFKEKITVPKLLALILTFAGCILVSGIAGGKGMSLKGFIIGLGAGLGYGLYSIFSRYALKKYDSLTVTFYTFVFSSISIIPFCRIQNIPSILNWKSGLFILGIALFCTVLPYIFYTFGLSGLETGKAAILVTVEPLVGTLVGFLLWKEEVSVLKIIGIVLIFAAIILCSWNPKNTKG